MRQRVLTAALLIPVVLGAVFVTSFYPIYLLAVLAFAVGYGEIGRLAGCKRVIAPLLALFPLAYWGFIDVIWGAGDWRMRGLGVAAAGIAIAVSAVGAIGGWLLVRGARGYLVAELISLWLLSGLMSLLFLHAMPRAERGLSLLFATPILLALIPLWIGDTLAIFVGRAFGKRLLAPKISPKKTVEGSAANLVGCLAGALAVGALIGQPLVVGLLAGLATGILGQAGDLLESAMKRAANVKDSGNLLPGHGGLLDRIDSILLSAPAVALAVAACGSAAR